MENSNEPSPSLFFDTATAYQKSAAIKAALDLDIFTIIAGGATSAADIAGRCGGAERGVRILCDYLTVQGFLTKAENRYALTRDSAVFLDRNSPAYAGGAADFLLCDHLRGAFDQLTSAVKKGGTADRGTVSAEHPVWISFARSMGPIMGPAGAGLADLLQLPENAPSKVLDISASHGLWGIAFAQKYAKAEVVAQDWGPVLPVAEENARAAGVSDRFSLLPGSAFEVELGSDFDVVLVPNFVHHFSVAECETFFRRVHAALKPGGRIAIVEFVPNADRITPPAAAGFSLVMLATTPEGDAYTFDEYATMLNRTGFKNAIAHPLPASMNVAIIAER